MVIKKQKLDTVLHYMFKVGLNNVPIRGRVKAGPLLAPVQQKDGQPTCGVTTSKRLCYLGASECSI